MSLQLLTWFRLQQQSCLTGGRSVAQIFFFYTQHHKNIPVRNTYCEKRSNAINRTQALTEIYNAHLKLCTWKNIFFFHCA